MPRHYGVYDTCSFNVCCK